MRKIYFHPEAETEMLKAAIYYESQQPDLGKRFLSCVQSGINGIQINPFLYPIIEFDHKISVRRCLTKTFPFGILFSLTSNQIIIMAIMNLHRNPNYWEERGL
ncbi:MAG: type II toxin-antitoxin system RelE/ParE family toxin [Patescibacteria group bacterium]